MESSPRRPSPRAVVLAVLAAILAAAAIPAVIRDRGQVLRSTPVPRPLPRVASDPAPPAPTIFRFYQEIPTTLDPALAADAYSSTVIAQIYSPLVGLTASLEPTPQVADSWTVSPDGLSYVFHIREGVRFHNGREVVADDFAYSLVRLFREPFRSEGLAANYLDAIEGVPEFIAGKADDVSGIRVLDPHLLEIHLSRPYGALLSTLALDQTSAVPRELIERDGPAALEERPIGCGPFRFVRRNGERSVILAANPEYFMGRPAIDTLAFRAPPGDVAQAGAEALLSGHATLSQIPPERAAEFEARPGIDLLRWQDLSIAFIGMNAAMPPLDDVRVRRAVALALDRDGMIRMRPEGKTYAQGILPPGLPGSPLVRPALPVRDVLRARALLAEAGYGPDHPLPSLTLWRSISSLKTRGVDSLLIRSLAEAGIRVTVRYESWAVLDSVITGRKAHMFALSWVADIPDPDTFLRALFHSGSSTNYFQYASARVDSLLDAARSAVNTALRAQAYGDAETTVLDDAPFVPLYHTASFIGTRREVAGLEMNPLGISTLAIEKLHFVTNGDHRSQQASR